MIDLATLGDFVARRRKELGLTQQDIAASLGYTVQAISRFEKGQSKMDLASLPALANALGLSLDDLLHENDNHQGIPCSIAFNGATLAANLVYLRNKEGLTQEAAASIGGVSKRSLANYEKGLSRPSLGSLLLYLDHYGVTADDLFGVRLAPVLVPQSKKRIKPLFIVIPLIAVFALAGTALGIYFGVKAQKGQGTEDTGSSLSAEIPASTEAASDNSSVFSSKSTTTATSTATSGTKTFWDDLKGIDVTINGSHDVSLGPGSYNTQITFNPSDWGTTNLANIITGCWVESGNTNILMSVSDDKIDVTIVIPDDDSVSNGDFAYLSAQVSNSHNNTQIRQKRLTTKITVVK
jgi:transcriptional regulator with XRE-family HTH domain